MEKELFYTVIYNLFLSVLGPVFLPFIAFGSKKKTIFFLRYQQVNVSKRKIKPIRHGSIGKHSMIKIQTIS